MKRFRNTAKWVVGTSVALYLLMTITGVIFILGHENKIAERIVDEHLGAVISIYARIFVGYLAAGLIAALILHPLVKGWKAAVASLVAAFVGLVYTLTHETHLLYGKVQTAFCAMRDRLPAFVRDTYAPWMIELLFGAVVLVSLVLWTRRLSLRARVATVAAVLLGVAGAFVELPVGHAAPAKSDAPCFLLIATDSLRADHLSCNGYGRKTSPHIDALAARGTNFSNNLVPTGSTHESWVSLFSSTEPRQNGLRHMFPSRDLVKKIEREQTWFPGLLRDKGYKTAAVGGWCGTTFSLFDMGFEHVDVSDNQNHVALIAEAAFSNHLLAAAFLDNPLGRLLLPELERVSFTRGAAALTRKTKALLRDAAAGDKPFFITVVYHVTHLPYSASYPYYTAFTDPDYRGRNRYRIDFKIDDMIQRGFDHDLTDEEKQHIIDLYDGTIREFDDQVGALVAYLKELGLLDRTIVGVWADHGDNLYEHGTTLGHGVTLFGGDAANLPPAVFAGPGVPHREVDALTRSFDLTPTWARWLGVERPASWKGVDLSGDVPELTAFLETSYLLYRQPVPDLEPGEKVKQFPRFDEATHFDPDFDHNTVLNPELEARLVETKCFAVREGTWKLIYVPGENGPIHRLFDLSQDPECTRDLRREKPDVFKRLRELLPVHAR